ncbi:MAG: hypothetical protein IPI40_13610 [Betaproteobacteria bacterium]|nr:hypothetical protein [Betaproteobacteria bacterium]
MTALWPEADGAAAKTSFDTALFRLRKLLDVDHALPLSGGKLTLDPQIAWTDVRAFRRHSGCRAAGARRHSRRSARPHRGGRAIADGRLPGCAAGAEDEPWIAKPRRRAARASCGPCCDSAKRSRRWAWPAAIDVYRRGLEADNLAEPFYRGLMRSLAATGDQAEALVAFRRCRDLLSIVLGVKPSAETERLHRQLQAGGATPPRAGPRRKSSVSRPGTPGGRAAGRPRRRRAPPRHRPPFRRLSLGAPRLAPRTAAARAPRARSAPDPCIGKRSARAALAHCRHPNHGIDREQGGRGSATTERR